MATPTIHTKEPEIRKVYLPKGEEYDVLKHVYTRKQQMGDKRKELEGLWDRWEKQWEAYRPPKDANDWHSDIFIPITTATIEAELSEIIEQTLRPWVVERGLEDEPKARIMNSIMDYTWEVSKSDVALFDIIKDALIFGTGIGQEYYLRQPRTIKDKNGKPQKIFEYDDCFLEPVRLWDFYTDERGRSFSGPLGAADCIRRYIMDYDDFRTFFDGKTWNPMGRASLVKPGGDTNYYEFYHPPEPIEHDRQVEVLWYWNKPDDMLAVVANDVVVVMRENPYRHKQLPFVRVIDIKRPYQFYGKGEAELLEGLQEEVNTLRRMIIDRNHLDIDKPVFVDDTLTIEDEDVIAGPHHAIPVGDTAKIKFPEYSDIATSVFKSLDMMNDDRVRVTGMDERQQSVSTSGTATEAAILKEQTLKRLNMKMWHMRNDTLVDIGKLRVENIMQFYSQPKLKEIMGTTAVAKAEQDGTLVKENGKNYEKSFRNVRLKDQTFSMNKTTNQPELTPSKGFSFFEADPQFFLPTHGGFDIRYKATQSIPISKPLQMQKMDELYDRLIKNQTVDPWKLAEIILKSREVDPDDFKSKGGQGGPPGNGGGQGAPGQPGQGGQGKPGVQPDVQKIIDLASQENAEMMQGNKVGPTPYAPVIHTEMHIQFMHSDEFKKQASEKVLKIFTVHVMGEAAAQKQRATGGQGQGPVGGIGQPPEAGAGGTNAGPADVSMNDVAPGRMSGGGDTENVSGSQSQ